MAHADVGGIAYATGFIFIELPNGAQKICIIQHEIDPEFARSKVAIEPTTLTLTCRQGRGKQNLFDLDV